MYYPKRQNRITLLNGLQVDFPNVFIPWDTNEKSFEEKLCCHGFSLVVEKYYSAVNTVIFGEEHCIIGVKFEETISEFGISRDYYGGYDDYIRSYSAYHKAIERLFGKPDQRQKVLGEFEDCIWTIDRKIKIHHYVMERFCLEEHLRISRV